MNVNSESSEPSTPSPGAVQRKERSLAVIISIVVFVMLCFFALAFIIDTFGGRVFFSR